MINKTEIREALTGPISSIRPPFFTLIGALPGGFDAGIHAVLELVGICKLWRRSPWYSLNDAEMERLGAALKDLGILCV